MPVFVEDRVRMILDVDSDVLNDFDETDAQYMKQIAELLSGLLKASDLR